MLKKLTAFCCLTYIIIKIWNLSLYGRREREREGEKKRNSLGPSLEWAQVIYYLDYFF